jgi:Ser/Thr protein kinase RdoA (MazF antagonist)
MSMTQPFREILDQFEIEGQPVSVDHIGVGHIHKTFSVGFDNELHPGYILQQFNRYVFQDYQGVMHNTIRVTRHLASNSAYTPEYRIAHPVATRSGLYYISEQDGTTWRLFHRISPGISFDTVPNESVAYQAGNLYGRFLAGLSDLPVSAVKEVIPGFHSVHLRLEQLMDAVHTDAVGRLSEVTNEVRIAERYMDQMRVIPREVLAGKLPVRVTHNDTKLNNILFDEQNRAVAVVDLDTVMPGLSLFDFGDLVRTAANTGSEDGVDAAFSLPLYEAIKAGYLEGTKTCLTPDETTLLPLAPPYMAYIMAIRFLADYLNGDLYYTIHNPYQNLYRCRAQFSLMLSMLQSGITRTDH